MTMLHDQASSMNHDSTKGARVFAGVQLGRRQIRSGGANLGEKAMRAMLEWPGSVRGSPTHIHHRSARSARRAAVGEERGGHDGSVGRAGGVSNEGFLGG